MVIIFDLDDTLYDEITYVKSGLNAVANWGEATLKLDKNNSYQFMVDFLEKNGRGRIFNEWLKKNGIHSLQKVKQAIKVYRHHLPDICVSDSTIQLLKDLSSFPLYIVTDGHKVVQKNKVEALDITGFFKHVFITHRYGIKNAKPSTYCFEKICAREQCAWEDMVYIGDNPAKDFVNLKPLGMQTVRVLTGSHSKVTAQNGFDANYSVSDLGSLKEILNKICVPKV